MKSPTGYESTLEGNVITAIEDLFADIEGRNLKECIAQFHRVQDYLTARINNLECCSELHVGSEGNT